LALAVTSRSTLFSCIRKLSSTHAF
jgi:hypothetical protein